MEQVQNETLLQAGVSAPAPAASVLESKHNDKDILEGCPREFTAAGFKVKQRAFVNAEYTQTCNLILVLGFLSTCETPEDVDNITLDDIFNNIAFQTMHFDESLKAESLEQFLFNLMNFEGEIIPPRFGELPITKEEYMRFLGIIIEQNNLMKHARLYAKKNLKMMQMVNNLRLKQESESPV